MKKMVLGVLTAMLAVLTGCKPTVEQMTTTATSIGYAAGLVANQTGINDDVHNAIIEVLGDVRACVPTGGQSYADAWTPVIKAKVAEFVDAGKLDAAMGEVVTSIAIMAAKGVDYLFDVRFPDAKQYSDLVTAGVAGAVDGFLTAFKPVNGEVAKSKEVKCDEEAYKWFKANLK